MSLMCGGIDAKLYGNTYWERYPQFNTVQEMTEDFRITDEHLGEGNRQGKFGRNIAAITNLQTLEKKIVLHKKWGCRS